MRKLPSGNWNTVVKVNGKPISVTAPTKAECEYLAAQYKTQRKKKIGLTVNECVDKYIAISELLSPTTIESYKKIQKFAFQSIMDLPIDELNNVIVQNAINLESKRKAERTGKQISSKTVVNEWSLLSAALKTVAGRVYIVKLPRVQRKNKELPEPVRILQRIKGTNIELPCLLAAWCGLRLSEIRGLTFDSIHDDYISIDKVMLDVGNKSVLTPLAKTDLSIRKVPMPKYIKDMIKSLDGAENDLVVPLTRNAIYHHFTRLMMKEGIDISVHDLRHVFASVMLTKLQIPEKIVQKSGGWKSDYTMKTVYSNTFTDSEKEAAKVRDNFFEAYLQ